MAIEIINGHFVYREGVTTVVYSAGDGVHVLPPDMEARLVAEGVARYVDKPAADIRFAQVPSGDTKQDAESEKESLEALKVSELREMLKARGLPCRVGMTKAEMIKALQGMGDEAEDDGDSPPVLNAEGPVVT